MQTKLYEDYAVLDAQIKALQNKRDELKADIIQDIVDSGEPSVTTAVGKFTVANLKTWSYSKKVEEMNEQLKAQKATEESTGEATYEEKPSLRFTQIKF